MSVICRALETTCAPISFKFRVSLVHAVSYNRKNFLYFQFATPVVQEFERLNSEFQQTKANLHELHEQLLLYQSSLSSRIRDATGRPKIIEQVDFEKKFLSECDHVLSRNEGDRASINGVKKDALTCWRRH